MIGRDGIPLIYFTEDCQYVREYLPAIERDDSNPETYVDSGEATHTVDCVKLACNARPLTVDAPVPTNLVFENEAKNLTPQEILKRFASGRL